MAQRRRFILRAILFAALFSASPGVPIFTALEKSIEDTKLTAVRQETTQAPTTTTTPPTQQDLPKSPYKNSATTEPLPTSQPAQTRQQTTSILIQNNSFDDKLLLAMKECLGVGTGTVAEQWGLWEAQQFSSNMIQAEFYCNVPERIAGTQFRTSIHEYVTDQGGRGLTSCLKRRQIGFTGNARLGREPEDRDDLRFDSVPEGGGTSSFIPGILIGILGLICLVGVLVTAKAAGQKTYDPSDYAEVERVEPEPRKELSEQEELAMLAQ